MVKRKWLWGKSSSEKMDGETENSGSISSQSEKCSEDQDALRGSPGGTQLAEVTSRETDNEMNEVVPNESLKSSAKKLSDASIDGGSLDSLSQEDESNVSEDNSARKLSNFPVNERSLDNLLKQDVSKLPVNKESELEKTPKTSNDLKEDTSSVKLLTEKLCAALLNVSLKDDLVKQHAKVAEEAVAGWEKAEKEATAMKQQLETAVKQKLAVEARANHLDEALKECVRQLRLAKDEQERKINQAVAEKTNELELARTQLEDRLIELQALVETSRVNYPDPELLHRLEILERENASLRKELEAQSEELELRTIERDLSTKAAETASKQHLESIKKVAKLEAECRKLRSNSRVSSIFGTSSYPESLTDSLSDSGEQLSTSEADNRKIHCSCSIKGNPNHSESWASALIAELDQFKSVKMVERRNHASSVKIDLMDDFLEMERLAALPDVGNRASEKPVFDAESKLRVELETVINRTAELEEKTEKVEAEKAELTMALAQTQSCLENSQVQLIETQMKLELLGKEVWGANGEEFYNKRAISLEKEAQLMCSKVESLTAEVDRERARCEELENELEEKKKELEIKQDAICNGELEMKEMALTKTQESLENMLWQSKAAETELRKLEKKLEMANEEKKSLESQLDRERALTTAKSDKCEELQKEVENLKKEVEIQLEAICNGELKMKEMALAETLEHLEKSQGQLREAEMKLKGLEEELDAVKEERKSLTSQPERERASSIAKSATCEELQNEIEKMKRELDEIQQDAISNSELNVKEMELAETREALDKSQGQLREAETKLVELKKELDSANEEKKTLKSQLDRERALLAGKSTACEELQNELEKMKKELENQQDAVSNSELKMKEMALAETQESLDKSQGQLRESKTRLVKLENELDAANEEKEILKSQLDRERALLVKKSTTCEVLQNELEKKKRELENQQDVVSNSELKMKEMALAETQESLDKSLEQLREAKSKLVQLEKEIDAANKEKKSLKSELDSVRMEIQAMSTQIESLKERVQKEQTLAAGLSTKCMELENELLLRIREFNVQQRANSNNELKIKQEDIEVAEGKLADCQKTIASLGTQLKSLATLEDFLIDTANIPGFSPPAPLMARRSTEPWKLHSNHTFLPEKEYEPMNDSREGFISPFRSHNGRHTRESPAFSSSSTSPAFFVGPPGYEKNGNGFAKYFALSRN